MEKYENLAVVGEGSYGLVMKCRHRETGQVVAIKKFIETEEDQSVRKMALREIRMLKKLRHENLVNMIEVFRRKRRFYLVFEYMDHTVLDELEEHQQGLGEDITRSHIFQVLRGIDFCHVNHIVHRDVKPENVLVSPLGVIKLCDFGFARLVAASPNETYTDYVATRWYRAPELLVGDTKYGKEVDIWAIGCLFAEMMSGDPLFPGDSDIDQLFQICKLLGRLAPRHLQMVARNPMYKGLRRSAEDVGRALSRLFPQWEPLSTAFVAPCLRLDPAARPSAAELLQHPYFTHDRFPDRFMPTLRSKVQQELQSNPLLRKHLSLVTTAAAATAAAAVAATRRGRSVAPADAMMIPGAVQPSRRSSVQPAPRWRFDLRPPEPSAGAGDADSARGRIAPAHGLGLAPAPPAGPASLDGSALGGPLSSLAAGSGGGSSFASPMRLGAVATAAAAAGSVRRKMSDTAVEMMEGGGGGPYASLPPQPSMQAAGDASAAESAQLLASPSAAAPANGGVTMHQLLHPSINNLYFTGRDASVFAAKLLETPKRSPLPLPGHLREPVTVMPRSHMVAANNGTRRFERSLLLDTGQQTPPGQQPPPPVAPPPTQQQQQQPPDRWLVPRRFAPASVTVGVSNNSSNNNNSHSSRSSRGIGSDDFSLPNLPGASGSPSKGGKKKLHPVTSHGTVDPFISPDFCEALSWHSASSTTGPKKRKRTSIELPHLGK